MIAFLYTRHSRTDINDNAGTFVTKNRRKDSFRITTRQSKFISVTNARGFYLD